MSVEQYELDGIVEDLSAAKAVEQIKDRALARTRHRESMACCWEEWEGNNGIKIGTRIEVGSCVVPLETPQPITGFVGDDGESGTLSQMYAYCAPCYIAEVISPEEFIAVIDYPERIRDTVPYCYEHNGIRLRLDILDIWPPCGILADARRKAEVEKGEA